MGSYFGNKYDRVEGQKDDAFYETVEAEDMTGWQRLRNLFRKTHDDIVHPEVTELMHNSITSFIVGGIYGALVTSRTTFINFIENNEATQFRNHLDAKRKLSDAMFMSYANGFVKWGVKVSIFVTAFTGTQLALSVYHNKYAFWHYTFGGATAGALYKFQLGPKGMISGAIFGGFFGTLYGTSKVILLKLTNQTDYDLLKFRQNLQDLRDEYTREKNKKQGSEKIQNELKQAMTNPKKPIETS